MSEQAVHHGRNIKRIREIQGIKQEALALELGEDWNQKKISLLEAKERIDDELLEQVASVLKVTPEAIKNFDDEAAMNVISNTFTSHDNSTLNAISHQCTINPLEKYIEMVERTTQLYERLLQSEREKVELLERLLNERK